MTSHSKPEIGMMNDDDHIGARNVALIASFCDMVVKRERETERPQENK